MPVNKNKIKTLMSVQTPDVRRNNFNEVALGYTEHEAINEAKRCLQCKKPSCMEGCPVHVQIPQFIKQVAQGSFDKAIRVVKETNNLPAICGRVCPQESQCEGKCVLGRLGEPVAIGRLERFVADWERNNNPEIPSITTKKEQKIAVIGSGPSGLTCAADLAKSGCDVTIFEAFHQPGGVLVYGIPEFRLPKAIVQQEIEYIKKLGVKIKTDMVVGKVLDIDDLFDMGYKAVYIGTGAGLPRFMDIPGENLLGVYSANEFLTRINLMKAYTFPKNDTPIKIGKRVAVVGGGNVAMDAARSALRLGAEEVNVIYRRSEDEMPARREEYEHALEEGIKFEFLANPSRILGNAEGWTKGIECVRMELGEPDASGRRRPVAVNNSEFIINVDMVIIAIGTGPNPLLTKTVDGMELNKWGGIIADESGRTTRERVWAGGDIVTGAATVILAMGAGKAAARDINEYLTSELEQNKAVS